MKHDAEDARVMHHICQGVSARSHARRLAKTPEFATIFSVRRIEDEDDLIDYVSTPIHGARLARFKPSRNPRRRRPSCRARGSTTPQANRPMVEK